MAVDAAKAKRDSVQSFISQAITELSDLTAQPISANNLSAVAAKIKLLNRFDTRLQAADNALIDAMVGNKFDPIGFVTECQADSKALLEAITAAEQYLEDAKSNRSSALDHSQGEPSANLPKLDLPQFDGEPIHWQEFSDLFRSTIGDRTDLRPIEKLSYLKSCLSGEASHVVAGFRMISENYPVV